MSGKKRGKRGHYSPKPKKVEEPIVEINIKDVATKFRGLEIDTGVSVWDMLDLDFFFNDKPKVQEWFENRYADIDDWVVVWEVYQTDFLRGIQERIEDYLIEQGLERDEAALGSLYPFIRYITTLGTDATKAVILMANQAELGFDSNQELYERLEFEIDDLMKPWKSRAKVISFDYTDRGAMLDRSEELMEEWGTGKMTPTRITEVLRDCRGCRYTDTVKPNCFFCSAWCWKSEFVGELARSPMLYQKYVNYDEDDDDDDSNMTADEYYDQWNRFYEGNYDGDY